MEDKVYLIYDNNNAEIDSPIDKIINLNLKLIKK